MRKLTTQTFTGPSLQDAIDGFNRLVTETNLEESDVVSVNVLASVGASEVEVVVVYWSEN